MGWLRLGDESAMHPVAQRMDSAKDERLLNEVFGFVTRCSTMAAGYETDFFVSEFVARQCGRSRADVLVRVAIKAGAFSKQVVGPDGQRGWIVSSGEKDELWHMLLKDERKLLNEKKAKTRKQDVRLAVRLRDGDQCRYCAGPVNFKNRRRSNLSGTYSVLEPGAELDHPDPSENEVVVSCWPCNAHKGGRTPEQAGMTLLPPPATPWYRPDTVALLAEHGFWVSSGSDLGASGSDPDQTQIAPGTSGSGLTDPVPPGRVVPESGRGGRGAGEGPGRGDPGAETDDDRDEECA